MPVLEPNVHHDTPQGSPIEIAQREQHEDNVDHVVNLNPATHGRLRQLVVIGEQVLDANKRQDQKFAVCSAEARGASQHVVHLRLVGRRHHFNPSFLDASFNLGCTVWRRGP